MLASLVGWTLPVGGIAINDAVSIPGIWGAVALLAAIALGGVILGLTTGAVLERLPRRFETA